jgi:hypothetical protein
MGKRGITHEGLHTNRLRVRENVLENKFAEAWEKENSRSDGHDLLDYLLALDNNNPRGEFSQRDATVAATIIQWLGTHVGQCFLRDVMGKAD